jgi:hypothetical protein
MAVSVALALAMATLSGAAGLLRWCQHRPQQSDIGEMELRSSWDQYLDDKNEHAA